MTGAVRAIVVGALTMLMVVVVASGGCAGTAVRARTGTIDTMIATARDNGAMRCAPVELAMAESHNDFAKQELSEGNYYPAKREAEIARLNAQAAIDKSPRERCAPAAAPPPGPGDIDGDGILDNVDDCPRVAEDKDGFQDQDGCPEDDNDRDTVLDVQDDCPNDYGDPANNGCPWPAEPDVSDRDGDGIADDDDACPDEPGSQATHGCPDRDGDRVPDNRDECPDTPGDPRADPETSNGCPSRVVVTKEKIVILEKVFFEFNKAVIKHESYSLLDEVAMVILDHPEIKAIEVAGHTDADGNDAYNLKLSQARAESVRNYLAAAGVAMDRLEAHGYGETVPIDSNQSETGKANNRRVEFVILGRD